MKKIKILKWLLPILIQCYVFDAQAQLNRGEYFFDADPGVGNGMSLSPQVISGGTIYDSTAVTTSVTVPNNMSPGNHTLYVRYADNINGEWKWSNYEARKFIVNPISGNTISLAEYFFDTDPGIGNATPLALSGNVDSSSFAGNISTTGLLPGYHTLHIRARNVQGFWSNYETRKIKINVAAGSSITEAEYFYDVDPGIGNATSISLSGNTDSSDFSGSVSTVGLSLGTHQLCIRAKNAFGEWSIYETRKIKILSNGNALANAEYFYDTDPGIGNGTALTTINTGDSSSFSGNIPTTGLTPGKHLLFIRAQNIEGSWSIYEQRKINIIDVAPSAEYFFDTDPGIGNGTAFSLNDIGNSESEFAGNILTAAGLSYGPHQIFIRTKDNQGNWGMYDSLSLFINCKNPALPALTQITATQCGVEGTLLTAVGSLNDAAYWNWYSGSCGGTLIDTGSTIFVAPSDSTIYYVRGEGGCVNASNCTPIEVAPQYNVSLKLFLQGYYIGGGAMNPVLLNQDQNTCDNVTDTIDVELRHPIDHTVLETYRAILHTDGMAYCKFSQPSGNYYLSVKHRNSIATWSLEGIYINNILPTNLTASINGYDFTLADWKAIGSNQIEVEPGVWAFYTGDMNQDEFIDGSDYPIFDLDSQNNVQLEYVTSDLNGDGYVDASDYPIFDLNSQNNVQSMHP